MQDDNTERLAKIDKLDPGQAETILKIVVERLSVNEPHSSGNQVPLDFRDELSTTFEDASESERDDFAKATLRFLSSDQEAADLIGDALMDAEGAKLVDPGTVAIVAGTVFVLQSHIKIARSEEGKWNFVFEKRKTSDALLKTLLTKLTSLRPERFDEGGGSTS